MERPKFLTLTFVKPPRRSRGQTSAKFRDTREMKISLTFPQLSLRLASRLFLHLQLSIFWFSQMLHGLLTAPRLGVQCLACRDVSWLREQREHNHLILILLRVVVSETQSPAAQDFPGVFKSTSVRAHDADGSAEAPLKSRYRTTDFLRGAYRLWLCSSLNPCCC